MKLFKIKVLGEVQGVGFRFFAKQRADNLGIKGFAQNEPDGSVYIEAEGEEKALGRFLDWCKMGPEPAEVKGVEVKEGEVKNYSEFEISAYQE